MDERTLTALQGSIAKWNAIAAGTGKDEGPLNCPLCQLFHPDYRTDKKCGCEGCPIAMAGYPGCTNGAYDDYCVAADENAKTAMHEAAIGELDFLKSLLPSGEGT